MSDEQARWLTWGLATCAVVGALARLEAYLDNPSMWLDEAGLALSFLDLEFAAVLRPLPVEAQQAPPLFNLLALAVVRLFGTDEFAFRLVPLASSVASVGLFAWLASRMLPGLGALIAAAAFAATPMAIRYAGEFKPYASDLLVAILILALALWMKRSDDARTWVIAAGIGVALAWVSYTAIFLLAGAGVALLHAAATTSSTERRRHVVRVILVGTAWVSGFFVFWWLVGRKSAHPLFFAYWADAFAPFPPTSPEALRWYPDVAGHVMADMVGLEHGRRLGVLLVLAGAVALVRRDRFVGLLVGVPLVALGVVSAAGQYPIHPRLVLFTLPTLLIFMAEAVHWFAVRTRRLVPGLGVAAAVLVLAQPVTAMAAGLGTGYAREETRSLVDHYLENRRPGDWMYCYYKAEKAFAYYTRHTDADCIVGVEARDEPWRYTEDLQRLIGAGRVWFLFSHVFEDEERQYFIPFLDSHGKLLEVRRDHGASLYLYRL